MEIGYLNKAAQLNEKIKNLEAHFKDVAAFPINDPLTRIRLTNLNVMYRDVDLCGEWLDMGKIKELYLRQCNERLIELKEQFKSL